VRIALCATAALVLLQGASGWGAEETSSVRIVSPAQRGHVSGLVTVEMQADSPRGVQEVSVTRDGSFLETASAAPYRVEWDTRKEADGPHNLVAKATDKTGMQVRSPLVTVTVDNTPPVIQLIKPGRRATVVGLTPMEAEASDLIGVAQVRFLVDGTWVGSAAAPPYRFTWDSSLVSNGVHVVEARALDRAGNNATAEFNEIRIANRRGWMVAGVKP